MNMDLMDYLRPIGILVLFFLILYGAYWTSRYAAKFQGGRSAGRNMNIVEAISVGPQKTLQIIRVGKTYMVVGVSRDRITYLREIDSSELTLSSMETEPHFGRIMGKIVQKQKKEQSDIIGEEQDEPFEEK